MKKLLLTILFTLVLSGGASAEKIDFEKCFKTNLWEYENIDPQKVTWTKNNYQLSNSYLKISKDKLRKNLNKFEDTDKQFLNKKITKYPSLDVIYIENLVQETNDNIKKFIRSGAKQEFINENYIFSIDLANQSISEVRILTDEHINRMNNINYLNGYNNKLEKVYSDNIKIKASTKNLIIGEKEDEGLLRKYILDISTGRVIYSSKHKSNEETFIYFTCKI